MDFYKVRYRTIKNGYLEVYPDFKICRSKDLMVRGKSFYAVWDEEKGLWSTDEYDVQRIVDKDLKDFYEKLSKQTEDQIIVKWMGDFSTNSWSTFKNYINKISDNSIQLDEKLTFSDQKVTRDDHVSKRLNYALKEGDYSAYDEIIGTLYEKEEREKIEWAIGSVISGDSISIQKFLVLYGEAGAGKSTILNIIQMLFDGYYTTFEAKALVETNNTFSTEVFKTNPLVAIQHDGDLSKIEDNTKLNSIISHEYMVINEKHKPSYTARANSFLFMATNRPVKITDAKSGIIRRLIDVKPSGNRIHPKRYRELMNTISFELGAIAHHCKCVYEELGRDYYNGYIPFDMIFQTDVFFNFVEDNYVNFRDQDGVSLKQAYTMYKEYCDDTLVSFKLPMYKFREELKNYFEKFYDVIRIDGKQVRSYYEGFIKSKFSQREDSDIQDNKESIDIPNRKFSLTEDKSILDDILKDCQAQYASEAGVPLYKWKNVKTHLSDIDTRKTHYLKVPKHHIVIDFDLKDDSGEKSLEKNLEAIESWPLTYAEFSNGGKGIHLHYIYEGDPDQLSRLYSDNIEIKVFSGDSSLRRRVSKCNNAPIATISSGLPFKEKKSMINLDIVRTENGIRELIKRNIRKEIHPATKPSVDFIYKILEEAYSSGTVYDVTDMRPAVLSFACGSTNRASYCVSLVNKMHFKSETESQAKNFDVPDDESDIVFYDVEVFPNLFLINWKFRGKNKKCVRMINPTPDEVSELLKMKLVGFNCRRYDNHMLYARAFLLYSNEQLFELSQRIISKSKNAMFREAYNISYTDVYDFASAGNKKSLKKFEIELGIHHQELGIPWDQPVPESDWPKVAEYCDNDVIATEAVFDYLSVDWKTRKILADISGLTYNDTTNSHTKRIIFGDDPKPQSQFNYRDLSKPVRWSKEIEKNYGSDYPYRIFDQNGEPTYKPYIPGDPLEEGYSIMPFFPGYSFEKGVSTYRGYTIGEGGWVFSDPGMYAPVDLNDIKSMHPSTIDAEVLFGKEYTKRFSDLKKARVLVKDKKYEELSVVLDGKFKKYIGDDDTMENLSTALKTPINSVYGLTFAKFDNAFRDPRNKDNIVAKRGALFMVNLKMAVEKLGYKVVHIKTDSIKVENADPFIMNFINDYGKEYGYIFDHEATYERFCLVNNAVYIARYDEKGIINKGGKHAKEWTATGAQFAHPYVFKKLFTKEPIAFPDMCETKSVETALYLDMNENLGEDEHDYKFVGKVGSFCPIIPGAGGGILLREKNENKYDAVGGTKGYRWLESEMVLDLHIEDRIDKSYFDRLANAAISDISEYGDFEWFVSNDPIMESPKKLSPDELDEIALSQAEAPPWLMPCGREKYGTCEDCDKCCFSNGKKECKLGYDID